ncbi:MAG: class I SAM-dependent methyltransferase [Xenococcaceae cyanobacterium MO_188.B32]|nr:class I SAM-dependent methyltransferase [Xenococcaceae cyanobacterium MO_188.B32]
MNNIKHKQKIEFGDFQTPIELAEIVTKKLVSLEVKPDIIIEPTCGIGNFLLASSKIFEFATKIIGIEINPIYLQELKQNPILSNDSRIIIRQGNFFDFQWSNLTNSLRDRVLVLGNFPWVTNSKQGFIQGSNLPQKNNFKHYQGLDAITGKSNFDISEWMLIKTVDWLQNYNSYLGMLCKNSVARKILNYIQNKNLNLFYCSTYKINSKKYFQTNVESCLLFCQFNLNKKRYFCDVFSNIDSPKYQRIGYYNQTLVRDLETFSQVNYFFIKKSSTKWRSGIKHDCSKVMELSKSNAGLINGFGEVIDIEDKFLYPLLKGSDVANGKIHSTTRYVLVTQNNIGESTDKIKTLAPKTWNYLFRYSQYLDNRKSKIYKNKPRFSIFGVGDYSFKKWKIAICGLYKKLDFKLIGEINNKPTFFDDTVYFIGFDSQKEAIQTLDILANKKILNFYSSLIFWDEKRPIKASILNKLDLKNAKYHLKNFN